MGQLDGKTVLITGGNGGIGLAMASAVGAAGAQVVIWGRNESKNAAALEQLEVAGLTAHAFACDVADPDQVQARFAESLKVVGGRIDAAFANAGVNGDGSAILDTDLHEWHRVMRTNLDSVFVTLQTAGRHMADAGGGALVAVSSTASVHGAGTNAAYVTAKTALLGLVRSFAVGLARYQIRANALLPGWTVTELASGGYENDKFRTATTARTPVRRWADPSEMGQAAVFLADPTQTFHTGTQLVVDGGYTIY